MRPVVQVILEELLARHRSDGRVHLNDLAEVIGSRAVSYDEVDLLIERLEAAGLRVGEDLDEHDVARMRTVLTCARSLRSELGRAPTVDEIATSSGHAPHVVRRALEDGQRRLRPPG